jgi:small conductance mechanosensitive channel
MDDIAKAKQILQAIMQQDARILADPAPAVAVGELADSSEKHIYPKLRL